MIVPRSGRKILYEVPTSNLTYDYYADLGVTLGAGRVVDWESQRGDGMDFDAGTSDPLFVASGGPNNLPYVDLDIEANSVLGWTALRPPIGTKGTVYVVLRKKASPAMSQARRLHYDSASVASLQCGQANPNYTLADLYDAGYKTAGVTLPVDTWMVLRFRWTPLLTAVHLKGGAEAVGAAFSAPVAAQNWDTFGYRSWCQVYSIHGYSVDMDGTAAEAELYRWFAQKCGL